MSSYKVLARKWRPQQFGDMIGQDHVLRALTNALDNQRIHHAYLFTGMRGVGKTTVARIFAKCLNCETKGVSSQPCGTCSACQDIDAGRFFDLIEVDAASRTKVDETRELLENVPYAPASGRYKVYLIDEVHMFSTHSFNALLKTLEEPPEHVKFLLATTDPQKVPVTVLSRCLQFNLKRMATSRLADYLSHILDSENMAHDKQAVELIARAADGSVRDSLSLVEQAAAFGGGEVRANDVESMLGRVSTDRLVELIASIGEADAKTLFERVEALAQYSPDYLLITGELLSLLHRIAMIQSVPESVDESLSGGDRLTELASQISAEQVQLYYQIGQHARRDMPYASDQREAFDMALLRMIAFAPQSNDLSSQITNVVPSASAPERAAEQNATTTTADLGNAAARHVTTAKPAAEQPTKEKPASEKVSVSTTADANTGHQSASEPTKADVPTVAKKNSIGRQLAAEALAAAHAPDTPSPASNAPAELTHPSTPAPAAVSTDQSDAAPIDSTSNTAADTATVGDAAKPTDKTGSVESTSAGAGAESIATAPVGTPADSVQTESIDLGAINAENWADTVDRIGLAGMPRQLAAQCVFNTREGDRLNLQMEEAQEHLNTDQFRARFQTALSAYTGTEVTIAIEIVNADLNTPAKVEQQKKDDALSAARAAIDEDPMVKELLSSIDGVVDASSVQPVESTQHAANKQD